MPRRKPDAPTAEEIKEAADRAEGLKPNKAKPGRPTSYQPTFAAQAEKLCLLGATDMELADFFEVDIRTIHRWKNNYPEFCHALKTGKELLDERVERSLFHKAVGYTFESEKVFQFQGEIVRAKTMEHVPPDTTACIFWLKNRRSQQWRDVHKVEHGQPGDFDNMNAEQLREYLRREAAELRLGDPAVAPVGGDGAPRGKPH